MLSNEELYNGIKEGKISLTDLTKWSDDVFTKVKSEYSKRQSNANDKVKELQSQIETLQNTNKALGDNSQKEKAELNAVIEKLNAQLQDYKAAADKELSGQINNLTVERDKLKSDFDSLNKEYRQSKLLNVARNITNQLKLKNADYAAQDLIRDGIITIGDDGKYKLNFEYFDDKTNAKLVATQNGTDNDLQSLIDGVKILATNKKTSYNRFGELYPEMVNVHQGSGDVGNGSPQGNNNGDKSLLDEYRELSQRS